jgi:hypothetical protein
VDLSQLEEVLPLSPPQEGSLFHAVCDVPASVWWPIRICGKFLWSSAGYRNLASPNGV